MFNLGELTRFGILGNIINKLPTSIVDFILRDSSGNIFYDLDGNCFTIGEIPSNVLLDNNGEVVLDTNGNYFTTI